MFKKIIAVILFSLLLTGAYAQFRGGDNKETNSTFSSPFGDRTKKAGGGPPGDPDGPISDYSWLLLGASAFVFIKRKKK